MRPRPDMVQALLHAGLRAPSADNRHTLRFAWRGDTLQVLSTDAPSWPGLPHRRLLAHMAYGAVLENLRLRSLELGLALHEQLVPDPAAPHCIADLQWTATSQRADPLSAHIETRHTNRRFYQRAKLSVANLEALNAAARQVPGTQLQWLDAPAQRSAALRAIRLAHHALGMRAGYLPAALSPHIGLVLTEDGQAHVSTAALSAGRAMQRIWLAAQAQGLALQPMAAATVLSEQQAIGGWVRPAVQARIRSALTAATGDSQRLVPCLLFRLGRASAPTVTACRTSPRLDAF